MGRYQEAQRARASKPKDNAALGPDGRADGQDRATPGNDAQVEERAKILLTKSGGGDGLYPLGHADEFSLESDAFWCVYVCEYLSLSLSLSVCLSVCLSLPPFISLSLVRMRV